MGRGGTGLEHERQARLTIALMIESDGPGGAENMLLLLGAGLRARGHEVCPVLPTKGCGWLEGRFRDSGFLPELFTLRTALDPLCVLGMARSLRRRGVDVIHSHEFTMAVYGAATASLMRRAHVITLHGGQHHAGRRRRRLALRWACRKSEFVASVSASTRDRYATSLGIPPDTFRVIANGVGQSESGNPGPVREELGIEGGELMILAVGNLYPVKGHATLIGALGRLKRRDPELSWKALIAGRGGEEERLRALAEDEDLGDRFQLLGFRSDVPNLLAAADIYVMPSLSEGLPLALLEAMFSGTAIVASGVGGIPEVVRDGEEAVLAPPGDAPALADALFTLAKDPGLRERLGTAARKRGEARYSAAAMVEAYERLYVEALRGR